MLQVKGVTFTHRKDLRLLLDHFQLVLNPGDKAVIIGEEGNGKSTLLKWIYQPSLVDSYIDAQGERILNQERLGYLPQEMMEEVKNKTVQEFFEEAPSFYERSVRELSLLAKKVGLPDDFYFREQRMRTLSGGEKVKAQMLRILLEEPTTLLLDEPSNDLDLATLEWLEAMIQAFPGTVLFISHDETLIEKTANMVIHLEQVYRKRECRYTVERMTYGDYVKKRLSAFNKQEQQAQDDLRKKRSGTRSIEGSMKKWNMTRRPSPVRILPAAAC